MYNILREYTSPHTLGWLASKKKNKKQSKLQSVNKDVDKLGLLYIAGQNA